MARSPAWSGALAGCLLLAGATVASAQTGAPAVEQMLDARFAPKQKDVPITTPAAGEHAGCTVRAIAGTRAGSTGWELLDAKKQPLRRYFGGKGAKGGIDTWCYFKDGVEVYREIDSNNDGVPDQFRWFHGGGLKWGMDLNGDGKIDAWRIISAEEVGHEAFQAVATGDLARLQALFITTNEMQALKLPAREVDRLSGVQKNAAKKLADLAKAQPQLTGAHFERVEPAVPSCVPGESIGAENDLIKFTSRAMLYETSSKKHEWLHTGELIQVGFAWRLVDVPTVEEPAGDGGIIRPTAPMTNPQLKAALADLEKIDSASQSLAPDDPKSRAYLGERIKLVNQIIGLADAKERDSWYKQLFDNLSTLAQNGDAPALKNLAILSADVAGKQAGSSLAAYGVYRDLWARYVTALNPGGTPPNNVEVEKIQKAWLEQLKTFVKNYPNAEDTTPDALHQLAMHTEFLGIDKEARGWYEQVYAKFPEHYLAEKCKGAVRRLDLPEHKIDLTSPQLQTGAPFDVGSVKGKLVVVYYWASYCNQCVGDFARLNKLYDSNPGKFELVCVNLDDTAEQALAFLKGSPIRGVHLFQPPPKNAGGMSSPLALQYGINGLPTVFLVRRDGTVQNRAMQVSDLENELKKGQ